MIYDAPYTITRVMRVFSHRSSSVKNAKYTKLITMVPTDSAFALREMIRWSRHCCSGGPKNRCVYNQSWNRFELFAKAHNASSMNGVVGNPGTAVPTAPKPKKHQASIK